MKCEECLASIEDYVDEEFDLQFAGAMIAHLAACRNCANVYEQLVREKQLYADYRRQVELPPLMWGAVRARIANEKTSAGASFLLRLREWTGANRVAATAACALICAVALIGFYTLGDASKSSIEQAPQAIRRGNQVNLPNQETMLVENVAAGTSAVRLENRNLKFDGAQAKAGNVFLRAVENQANSSASVAKEAVGVELAIDRLQEAALRSMPGTLMSGTSTPFDVGLVRREAPTEAPKLAAPPGVPFQSATDVYAKTMPLAEKYLEASHQSPAVMPEIANAMFAPQTPRRTESSKRFEAGVQLSSLYFRGSASPGIGTRFTYHVSDFLSLEAEGNVYPERLIGAGRRRQLGNTAQALFGAKIGRRWKKIGVFAKLRPGLMSLRTKASEVNPAARENAVIAAANEDEMRTVIHPVVDVGGVVEIYSSRRIVTRFDFGDTIVYNRGFANNAMPSADASLTKHNFQLGTGISLRF